MDIDFEELGFKCGLEIHQQLNTEKKLFCRCPVGLRNEKPDARILRHMRPTLSELGEYDGTALMEFKTKKQVIYELFRDATCTYEMDDTPPFSLNKEALKIALEIAMLLNCSIIDEIHISRKQYLDGSIPTGFQRTAIVGVEGWIPYRRRKIRIIQVTLEEDACREISDEGHTIVFRTDRLSIPLVEITTYPDMRNPREAAEVNEELGRILRSTGKIRRGIGTVRQDVNVSIDGGTRCEIKGVPKYRYVEKLTHNEALRQKALLQIKEILRIRGITDNTLHAEKVELDGILKNPQSKILREAVERGDVIKGIKLCGFAGLLNHETQPGITFAQEFSGRVKVIACIDKKPNILHSDDPYRYEIVDEDWRIIKDALEFKITDVALVVWGNDEDTSTALNEIKLRAIEATRGVTNETRQAFSNGTTDFERILPGPDRMYPDTDSEPTPVSRELIEEIRKKLPERLWNRESRYRKIGLPLELYKPLSISPLASLFDRIVNELAIEPKFVAFIFVCTFKNIARTWFDPSVIDEEKVFEVFKLLKDGYLNKEVASSVFRKLSAHPDSNVAGLLEDAKKAATSKNRKS